ncbi:disulfide bond formation protein B [Shewanella algae]|uniref:disulfide bond formation protein B n=2 Tax=Shewanella algae TaxID=38313 RepID=UPI0034D6A191
MKMNLVSRLFAEFKQAPLPALGRWQAQRGVWLLMAGAALFLLLSAMGYFQWFLAMDPCELCVYIRFSQCCILIAGIAMAIKPSSQWLKILGLVLAWYGVIQGMLWSVELQQIHAAAHMLDGGDIFATGGGGAACSTEPDFPLGLPLHEWLPYEFAPTGGCGEDDWSLLGMNMADYCIIAYSIFSLALGAVTLGWLYSLFAMK